MGHSFGVSIPHTSRSSHRYHLRWRLAIILFILALFQQQRLFFLHRHSLAAKYSPTWFGTDLQLDSRHEAMKLQDELLSNREAWTVLGEGWEGKVYAYNDSVIKTFTPGRSPFRNCAPGKTGETWPSEIAASLLFGGSDGSHHNGDASQVLTEGFLPVKSYFKASTSPAEESEWHLVTPLLKGGNLNTLAKRLAGDTERKTFRQLDVRFRPAFDGLINNMRRLHEAGYCHDDIKPANIFIEDDFRWALGDLGNVRHITHPYHTSSLWVANRQLEDCRANDVMRALKSYLKFIQMSASDAHEFNEEFLKGNEPLSKLFWRASANASEMSAAQLRGRSAKDYPTRRARSSEGEDVFLQHSAPTSFLMVFSRRKAQRQAVNAAIQTRMGEKLARWWGLVWLFGVPVTESCGV